jgi:hypothetical protein
LHDVLALETAESFEPIVARQVSTTAIDSDGGFSDEIVTIALPAHLLPYGAIIESMKTWNVGTIETVADLSVLARLWARYLEAEIDSDEETAIYGEWSRQAERVSPQCLPAVQQLDAAGLLRVRDLRTDVLHIPTVVRLNDLMKNEICITTEPDAPIPTRRLKAPAKKRTARKRSR